MEEILSMLSLPKTWLWILIIYLACVTAYLTQRYQARGWRSNWAAKKNFLMFLHFTFTYFSLYQLLIIYIKV